jgi:tetratricopeptide (TPR) repeat protein
MAESVDAVLVRAAQLTADGRPRAAIELLRPVLVVHPEHSGVWCRISVASLDLGEVNQSLDAAKKAITLGERSWAHRLASLALVELGRHAEAVVSAREAVRRDPQDWRCHVALAEALGATAPREAVAAARRAVELAPEEARPHEVLGDVAMQARDASLARRAYRDAARLDPGNGHVEEALRRLGTSTLPRVRPVPPAADRPPTAPRKPAKITEPARFGRVERTALWLLVRRAAIWLAVGSFILLIAGMPSPSPLLVWFALALAVFVVGLTGIGWLDLPRGARVGATTLRRKEPFILVVAGLVAIAELSLLVWTLTLAFGSRGMQLLTLTLACSGVAAAIGWLGLRRLRVPGR